MKHGFIVYDQAGAERNAWFIDRLIASAREVGLSAELVLAEELTVGVVGGQLTLRYGGQDCRPDFALVRTIRPLLSQQLEDMGIPVFNSARVSAIANDKRRTLAFAQSLGLPIPDSLFCRADDPLPAEIKFPCILKSADGHGGQEVFWADNPEQAEAARRNIGARGKDRGLLIQRPVSELGKDVRIYMIGQDIVTAVLRRSDNSFKSNFSLGGTAELYPLSDEERWLALTAARTLNADMVGIDLLFDNGQPVLSEVEDVVGTRMVYHTSELDMAALFMAHIARRLNSI